jgi:dienelactone hydrolase
MMDNSSTGMDDCILRPSRRSFGALALGLPDYLSRRINAVAGRHRPSAAQVRRRTRLLLGPDPGPVALRAQTTRRLERDGYFIENVVFQSRPDFWVTANLYVPATGRGPFPAILSPCGHYEVSRMHPDYQRAYQTMVRAGFVVLACDPIGQAERSEFHGAEGLRSVDEHTLAGQLLLLFNDSLTGYMVRDGQAGLDYLASRPEVDAARLGCAGHSGGGTVALYLSVVEPRIKVIAIHEGGTFHRWPLKLDAGKWPPISDVEQNLFGSAKYGIDVCDLHAALAPRPLLATIENYGPVFAETAAHLRDRYRALGVPAHFATEQAQARHAWTPKLRLANARWFCRHFLGVDGPVEETGLRTESNEDLQCLPARRGETVFSLLRRRGESLPARRIVTPAAIRDAIRLPRDASPELLASRWTPGAGRPVLALATPARAGCPVLSLDVRGTGETAPPAPAGQPPNIYTPTLFSADSAAAYTAWFMDESLLGMRVRDVLWGVGELLRRVPDHRAVEIDAAGPAAVWALFAMALDPRIVRGTFTDALPSYRSLLLAGKYAWNASVLERGILNHFDLPDVLASIAPREVLITPRADGRP